MKLHRLATSLALICAGLVAPGAQAQIVHVNAGLTTGANNGSSWSDAYQGSDGLRLALAAATPGAELWIAAGTYLPTTTGDRCARLIVNQPDMTLRGGFAGNESTRFERPERGQSPSYLSGDLLGNDPLAFDNSSVVLFVNAQRATLDRLHVIGGGDDQSSCNHPLDRGHAVWVSHGANGFSMVDCVVERCFRYGLRLDYNSNPSITGCVIRDVSAIGVFSHFSGGGVILDQCRIENCGFGIVQGCCWLPTLEFRNTLITGCKFDGIAFFAPDFSSLLATVRGCTIVGNGGYAVAHYGTSALAIHDGVDVKNSILWDNNPQGAGFGPQLYGTASAWMRPEDSIVQGGWSGPNVLDQQPEFVNPAGGDFALLPTSPAIDRGRGAGAGALDLARRHRAVDVAAAPNVHPGPFDFVDLGAFEFTGSIGENGDCDAEPNSTGRPGRLFARGSATAAANHFSLFAQDLPPQQFGMFLVSRQLGFTPMAGGLGTLCLGSAIGRFNRPGELQLSSASGSIALGVDLTRLPQPNTVAAVQPGETWRFQLWHREVPQGGVPTNQMTGLVTVLFD